MLLFFSGQTPLMKLAGKSLGCASLKHKWERKWNTLDFVCYVISVGENCIYEPLLILLSILVSIL